MEEMMAEPPMTNIGTDLLHNFGNFDDDEEPLDSGPVIPDIMKEEITQTVVSIENEINGDNEDSFDDDNDEDADEDLENGHASESAAPEALFNVPTPATSERVASAKEAGRASKSASRVPTPAKTPNSAKAKATVGRKRKLDEDAEELAAKRPSHGRATAAAAKEGIKQASKRRPRAAPGTVKNEVPKSGRGRPGRKPKVEKDEPAAEEYEVEDILDSGMDYDTKQVLFLVRWKGYGEESNTWEPKTNLTHAKELVKEFEAAKKKDEKAAKKGTTSAKKPAPAKKAPRKAAAKAPVKKAATKARPGRPARRGRPRMK